MDAWLGKLVLANTGSASGQGRICMFNFSSQGVLEILT